MKTILNTSESISTIAISYLDEEDEVLKEISNGGLYFSLSPFSKQLKRLFVIGDLLYNNKITIKAIIESDKDYEVKVKLNSVGNDFTSNTDTIVMLNTTSAFVNALPLDVLITSKSIIEKSVNLNFTITVEEV